MIHLEDGRTNWSGVRISTGWIVCCCRQRERCSNVRQRRWYVSRTRGGASSRGRRHDCQVQMDIHVATSVEASPYHFSFPNASQCVPLEFLINSSLISFMHPSIQFIVPVRSFRYSIHVGINGGKIACISSVFWWVDDKYIKKILSEAFSKVDKSRI